MKLLLVLDPGFYSGEVNVATEDRINDKDIDNASSPGH